MRSIGHVQVSRDEVDQYPAYGPLLAAAGATGRCPVLLDDPAHLIQPDDPQVMVAEVDRRDAASFLAARWVPDCPLCGCREAFENFIGLVPAMERSHDPIDVATTLAAGSWRTHLAIVPVYRPADVVAAVGWNGTCNHHNDRAGLSVVLRSWEERFGALLVRMDRSTLWLSVAAPPYSRRDCQAVAAEHFAFCREVDGEDSRPLRTYASSLAGATQWRFWWD